MNVALRTALSAAIGYGLGQVPSADLVTRAAIDGGEITEQGTGNPGALNVTNSVGKSAGTVVLFADIAKGFVAGRIGGRLAGPVGANLASSVAVVGHCYPPGRKGGKGVAASVGQVLATFPPYFPIDFVVAATAATNPKWKHRTFAANSVASVVWVAASVLWWRKQLPNAWGARPTAALPTAAALSGAVIAKRFLDEGTPG